MKNKINNVKCSDSWNRLIKSIPDIEEHIKQDKIKVIRLKEGMKEPLDNDYYFKEVSLEELKQHKGNYGILVGYNNKINGSSIAVADVDGYTINKFDNIPPERKEEVKQRTKEYIFNCLKNIPNSLTVETQSGGYHIYLWNETEEDNIHNISKALTFPSDFPIEELRDKSLKSSIELFTKFKSKYVVLPTAIVKKVKDYKTGKITKLEEAREYIVLNDKISLAAIGTVNNFHEEVKETMLANDYGFSQEVISKYNKRKRRSTTHSRKNSFDKDLKKLSKHDVKKVIKLIVDKYEVFPVIDGSKHDGALALGGYFSYHITKESSNEIANGIINKIGYIFRDSEAFKYTILDNYETNVEERVGLPTLIDIIEDNNPNFNTNRFREELNLICNNNFKKEKITTAAINNNQVPVYLYETLSNKWLKYEGIIKDIDLTLDFTKKIGSLIYTNTGKEIDSFKIKFNNNFFEITNYKDLESYLKTEGIELPKHFIKQINNSLRELDYNATKPKNISKAANENLEEDLPEDVIIFGVKENEYYTQSEETGIELKKSDGKRIISKPVANVVIKDVSIILDSLGILEPVYNITYYNKTFNKETTVEHLTKTQLTEEFIEANVFYTSTKENVETVLNSFIIDGANEGRITTKTEAYLEGFFIVDGKVIENTKLQNLKKYTAEDIYEAISLFNEIMSDRSKEGKANDSIVYRFMLWSPFSYSLKQIGIIIGLYSLILSGKSKANKTGAYAVGNFFYLNTEDETTSSTVSVLGSKLEENTFPKGFDESYNLIRQPEAPDVMKKAVEEKTTRITKNRNNNKETDVFNAFALPVFLLNEGNKIKFQDFIIERYKIRDYTNKSYLSIDKRKDFNIKYRPKDKEETVLRKLALIGNEFKKKIVPLIENKDKKLFDPEELTIEILKEIAEETSKATGKPIDFLPEMYTITEDSTNYNYDVKIEIPYLLNNEFKNKNRLVKDYTSTQPFINSAVKKDFTFLTFNKHRTKRTQHKEFIIDSSELEKYIKNNVEEYVELETILEALGLVEILKGKPDYKEGEELKDYVKKLHKITDPSGEGQLFINGFHLTTQEVINNLFGFNMDFTQNTETEGKNTN